MPAPPFNPAGVKENPYAVLGVPVDANADLIKGAYRRLARGCHPDRGGDAALFARVGAAYRILKDQEKRAIYDAYVARPRIPKWPWPRRSAPESTQKPTSEGTQEETARARARRESKEAREAARQARRAAREAARIAKAQRQAAMSAAVEAEAYRLTALGRADYLREMEEHKAALAAWNARREARKATMRDVASGRVRAAVPNTPLADALDSFLGKGVREVADLLSRPRVRVGSAVVDLDPTLPDPLPKAVMEQIRVPSGLSPSQERAYRVALVQYLRKM